MSFILKVFIIFQIAAFAEYRVFVLKITKTQTSPNPESQSTEPNTEPPFRTVISTLDPEQYIGYYPLEKDETIKYTETWKCYGNTGNFQPLCPNPKASLREPTSEASPPTQTSP